MASDESVFEQTADHRDRARPALGFRSELFPAGARDRVELGAAVVLARAPLALNPAFLLEPEQRRIDGALIERERSLRDLFDAPRDGVSVQRPHGLQRFQHHQIERAVGNFGRGLIHCTPRRSPLLTVYMNMTHLM